MARRGLRAVAVIAGTALPLLAAGSAFAFHGYSEGREQSYVNSYTGLFVERRDVAVNNQAATGCSAPYSGNPVYQTQWVLITSNAYNWIELGTGHQCDNQYRYYFWGYGRNGNWHALGESHTVVTGQTHGFRILREDGDTWRFKIDGANRGTYIWADQGAQLRAGMESYAGAAHVAEHTYHFLDYKLANDPQWHSWAGFDDQNVTAGPEMCGGWNTAASWRASENDPC